MKKYKDRYLTTILKVIGVGYLCAIIAGAVSAFCCLRYRDGLKEKFYSGEMTREEYIEKSIEFSATEEKVFSGVAAGFGIVFAGDVAFEIFTTGKEY